MARWDFAPPPLMLHMPAGRLCKQQPKSPTYRHRTESPAEEIFGDLFNSRPSTSDQRQIGVTTRLASRSVSSCGWSRHGGLIVPIDPATVASGASVAGWALRRLDGQTPAAELEMTASVQNKPDSLEPLAPSGLKNYVVAQLNQMYAYMEQAMTRERAKHSSDVSLMLRKVDKDLKETFRSVRETFVGLTEQVQQLLDEVESGKKLMRDVEAKFEVASRAAQVRAQYVEELEAVLDGQVPNISEAMRKLTEDLTLSRQAVEQARVKAEAREQEVLAEKSELHAHIKALEERLNQSAGEMKGAVELPVMQEMAATWTRRAESSLTKSPSPDHVDIVGSTLAKCDATRAVMRTKCVRPPHPRSSAVSCATKGRWLRSRPAERREESEAIVEVKRRAKETEQRLARQHHLISQATPSLRLLRDIFSELRINWRLPPAMQTANGGGEKDSGQAAKAPEILDRIVHLFLGSFHNLGKFSEILNMLCEETASPVAPHSVGDEEMTSKDVSGEFDWKLQPSETEGEAETEAFLEDEFSMDAPLIPIPKRRSWGTGPNLPNKLEEPAFTKRCFSPR